MSEEQIDVRRLREAFSTTTPGDTAGAACPSAEAIWEASQDTLDLADLRRMVEHIATCSVCTEAWRLASEISGDEASATRHDAIASSAHGSGLTRIGWASAAAAVVGFGLVALMFGGGMQTVSTARDAQGVAPALAIVEARASEGAACRVSWTKLEGATYSVRLLDRRLSLLAEQEDLTEPVYEIPADLASANSELRMYIAASRGRAGVVVDATFDLECTVP